MDSLVQTGQKYSIEATIIRADGRTENLGTVVGGSLFEKVASFIRIKFANLKLKLRTH